MVLKTFLCLLTALALSLTGCQSAPSPAPSSSPPDASAADAFVAFAQAPTPFRKVVGTRPPTPIPSWYGDGAHLPKSNLIGASQSAPPPVFQTSWMTPAWFVDPANVSTNAHDTNNCTSSASPCQTYAQIAARWGTYAPRLRQATTITFMSSQVDNTDPVYCNPYLENGASITIQGANPGTPGVPVHASGTMTVAHAKSRAFPGQKLTVTLGAGAALNQLIVNTTHPSRAWVYAADGGNWVVTQPSSGDFDFTPVDTWITGDSYATYTPTSVYMVEYKPRSVQAAFTGAVLQQITVFGVSGSSPNMEPFLIGAPETFYIVVACTSQKPIVVGEINGIYGGMYFVDADNIDIVGGVPNEPQFSSSTNIFAGDVSFVTMALLNFDNDAYATGYMGGGGTFGTVQISANSGIVLEGGTFTANSYDPAIMWGGGVLEISGNARVVYAGASRAQDVFLLGEVTLNGLLTGCSYTPLTAFGVAGGGGATATLCGVPLTIANLDVHTQGVLDGGANGYGGFAFQPNGGSIGNTQGY